MKPNVLGDDIAQPMAKDRAQPAGGISSRRPRPGRRSALSSRRMTAQKAAWPVVTTGQAGFWAVLRHLGSADRFPALGRLLA